VFAAISFYWAAGGTVGLETLGAEIEREALARDPDTVALVWLTGGLKVVGGLLALAMVPLWSRRLPRSAVSVLGWATGLLLLVYAAANFVQHGLMEAEAIDTPAALGSSAVTWHLALWDPFWLAGGVLFTAAAWRFGRLTRPGPRRGRPRPGRASESAPRA
jgi:Protein of unknown function (DUF3995)